MTRALRIRHFPRHAWFLAAADVEARRKFPVSNYHHPPPLFLKSKRKFCISGENRRKFRAGRAEPKGNGLVTWHLTGISPSLHKLYSNGHPIVTNCFKHVPTPSSSPPPFVPRMIKSLSSFLICLQTLSKDGYGIKLSLWLSLFLLIGESRRARNKSSIKRFVHEGKLIRWKDRRSLYILYFVFWNACS